MNARTAIRSGFACILLCFAVAAACQPKKTASGVPGGETTAAPQGGANAWCEAYCRKTVECRSMIPSGDPNKPAEQLLAECRAQTNGCQISQTTDLLCCSVQQACENFVACALS